MHKINAYLVDVCKQNQQCCPPVSMVIYHVDNVIHCLLIGHLCFPTEPLFYSKTWYVEEGHINSCKVLIMKAGQRAVNWI